MAQRLKTTLDYLEMKYTTKSGFSYTDDECYIGFEKDLKNLLKSITYKGIISFTCSPTISLLFYQLDGFNKVDDQDGLFGVYKGIDVKVNNKFSVIRNDFVIEYF